MDADFDDSDDKDYKAGLSSDDSERRGGAAGGGGVSSRGGRPTPAAVGKGGLLYAMPEDIFIKHIVFGQRLSQHCKCLLHATCKLIRRTLESPDAWKHLNMSFDVVGVRRSARTGRISLLSSTPLHFMCKDIVKLKRFRGITSADLRGLNLGSHTHPPALLADLLAHCPRLERLNLCHCYCTSPHFGISQGGKGLVEQMLADQGSSLRHLCIEASAVGLKKLVQGLPALRSLHLVPPQSNSSDISNAVLRLAFDPPTNSSPTYPATAPDGDDGAGASGGSLVPSGGGGGGGARDQPTKGLNLETLSFRGMPAVTAVGMTSVVRSCGMLTSTSRAP